MKKIKIGEHSVFLPILGNIQGKIVELEDAMADKLIAKGFATEFDPSKMGAVVSVSLESLKTENEHLKSQLEAVNAEIEKIKKKDK